MCKAVFSICLLGLASLVQAGILQQKSEWKLRIKMPDAPVYLKADLESPIIGRFPGRRVAKSYEAEGSFFRLTLSPDKDDVTLIGYVAAADVEVLEEKAIPETNFWTVDERMPGLGLSIMVGGGWSQFSAGELERGSRGMLEAYADSLRAAGYSVEWLKRESLRSGLSLTWNAAWRISRRWAVGLGGEFLSARAASMFDYFHGMVILRVDSIPSLRVAVLRPEVIYSIPLSSVLSFQAGAGPAVYFQKFEYSLLGEAAHSKTSFSQQVRNTVFGGQAWAGLEISLNRRAAVVLRARRRICSASDFKGEENYQEVFSYYDIANRPTISGQLYFVPGIPFDRLAVASEPPAVDARKAGFDYSGWDVSLGLQIRF